MSKLYPRRDMVFDVKTANGFITFWLPSADGHKLVQYVYWPVRHHIERRNNNGWTRIRPGIQSQWLRRHVIPQVKMIQALQAYK